MTTYKAAGKASAWLLVCMLGLPALGPARAAVRARNWPVDLQEVVERAAPVLLDIDADGIRELLIGTRKRLHALEPDGNPAAGFPVQLENLGKLASGLAGGKWPGAEGEVVVLAFGTEDGKLAVLEGAARPRAGFPVQLDGELSGPPVFADYDGDGKAELSCATRAGSVYLFDDAGRPLPGFPARVGEAVTTAVTVAALAPGERPVLIFGDAKGRLHAWQGPGKQLPGFPFAARYRISSQPVLGDLDDDGRYDIVFGSEDFKVYAISAAGKPLPGFPAATGYRIYTQPALADIDGDGVVEVIVAGGDGKLYVFAADGQALPGFPVALGRRLRASPVAGDVDGDGRPEILVGTDRGRLHLLRPNGRRYPGFPVRLRDRVDVTPLAADLDGDGVVEVVAAARNGQVGAWRIIRKGRNRPVLAWPAEARDAARSARSWPNPPRYTELQVGPAQPRTKDTLQLAYRHFDLDGDPEPQTIIEWYRDGKPVAELRGQRRVPAAQTRKHQRWWFTLRAGEGQPVFTSPRVEIGNTPPAPPQVAIEPAQPRRTDTLRLKIVTPAQDDDGDKIRYRVSWLRQRRPVKGLRAHQVPRRLLRKDERWTVVVRPFDGEAVGPPAHAAVTVVNSPPGPAQVAWQPAEPLTTDPVRVVITKPAGDPDGDRVSYRYEWRVAGKKLNLPSGAERLPAGLARKGQLVEVAVTSFDGVEAGAVARARVTVKNSPPGKPVIAIAPANPRTNDDLHLQLTGGAPDADADRLSYRVNWRRDGQPVKELTGTKFTVPAELTARGQTWQAEVRAFDGDALGPVARAEVRIGNTPPQPPALRARRQRVTTGHDLQLEIVTPARDADGDQLTTRVVWYEVRRGKRVKLAEGRELLRLPAERTRKGRAYLAEAISNDGQQDSPAVRQWFVVVNTPPPACRVTLTPARPTSGQELVAAVAPVRDADGDKLQTRFRWYRDGEPLRAAQGRERVAGKLVRAGQRWQVRARHHDGEQAGPWCQAEVEVVNSAPRPPRIALQPARPTTTAELRLQLLAPAGDPDGDEPQLRISWSRDGKHLALLDGRQRVPAGMTRKGQRWRVEVVAADGQAHSPPVQAAVVIANSAPDSPHPAIEPARPLSSDDLRCVLTGPTADADGDELSHSYSWHRPGQSRALHQGPVLPAAKTAKGKRYECRVTASDGELTSKPATVAITIANAEPVPPRVAIEPARPRSSDRLSCRVVQPARDPDGDRVKYRFLWYKDGIAQKFAPATDSVPARLTAPADIWQCQVVASDGRAEAQAVQSQEVVIEE